MFASFACFLLMQASGFSYSSEAAPVHRVVEQLAAKLGSKLFVGGPLREEVVTLRVRSMPEQELLDRLASVLGAKWEEHEKGLRLVVDPEVDAAQRGEFLARRTADVKLAIARMAERQKAAGIFDRQMASKLALGVKGDDDRFPDMRTRVTDRNSTKLVQQYLAKGPTARLLTRILLRMDPQVIAKLPEGMSIPFTIKPNRLQQALPDSAVAALQQYAVEQNLWASYVEEQGPDRVGHSPFIDDPRSFVAPVHPGELRILLRFAFDENGSAPQMTLKILQKEQIVGSYWCYLGGSYRWDGLDEAPARPKTTEEGRMLQLSEMATEWALVGRRKKRGPAGKELREFLRNPERSDPLTEASKLIWQLAEHRDVVAYLPDSLVTTFLWFGDGQKLSANRYAEILGVAGKLEVGSDLLTFQPRFNAETRSSRTPRSAFGTFVRAVDTAGSVRLDDYATFIAACVRSPKFLSTYLEPLIPGCTMAFGSSSMPMLRMYGHMSQSQRGALWGSGSVALMNLPVQAREVLERAVFYGDTFDRLQIMRSARNSVGAIDEPTWIFPDGLPSDALLTAKSATTAVVFGTGDSGQTRILSASLLADSAFAKERPDSDTLYQFTSGEEFTRFLLGEERSLEVVIHFSSDMTCWAHLTDYTFDPAGKEVGFDGLPEAFRKEYQNSLARSRKAYEKVPAPTSKTPPPLSRQ